MIQTIYPGISQIKKWGWMLLLLVSATSLYAQEPPKWAKKARSAVFSIITYDKDNNILNTGNGFFISEEGEALSDYTLFKGAQKAIAINHAGKQWPVSHILGANEMYDIIKLRVATGKDKITALPIDTVGVEKESTVWLLPYSTKKEATAISGKVEERVKAAEKYHYYTLQLPVNDKLTSCPVTNEAGDVVALIQKPYSGQEASESYAVDAHFAASLSIGALTANDRSLRAIGIQKALPATEKDALVYLYMKNKNENTDEYLAQLGEFIHSYPHNAEGYQRRAELYTEKYKDSIHFELAEQDIAKALEVSEKKADIHFAFCRMIYLNLISDQPLAYKDWDIRKATAEVQKAIAADSVPLYLQTEAELLFAQQEYAQAYRAYQAVNRTNMATAATYLAAAKSLQLTGDSTIANQVVALIDSAINTYARPYPQEVAHYLWERAQAHMAAGEPRKAVLDYNEYHALAGSKVNAHFFFQREQAALAARMNQLAVDDITQAIMLAPDNADYLAEHASLMARFNRIDDAITSCLRAIELVPDYADCHRILGVCYIQKGEKEKACQSFHKAKELGDEFVDALIEKHCQ